jgi:hypothetical protein
VKEGHTMNFENIAIGSLLGTLGHVLLDGMVYPELNFIWPFGFWNDFSSLLAYADAARICEVLFVLGIVMFGVKTMYKLAIARVTRKEQLQLEPDVMQEQIGFSDSLHAHDVNDSELPVQTSCSASYADKYKQPRTNLQKICPNRKFTIYDKKIKEKNTKQKSGPKINRIIIKRKNKK